MPITVIECWGSPGSGKSTFAADCFVEAAKRGLNAHLVTEFIKDHANRKLAISDLDQAWITGEQTRKESGAYEQYEYIFTDSPVLLASFFDYYYNRDDMGLSSYVVRWENRANLKHPINRIRVFLPLVEEWYKQTGRYESFKDSQNMSLSLQDWIPRVIGHTLPIIDENRNRVEFVDKYLLGQT